MLHIRGSIFFGFLELVQSIVAVACGDIPRSVALVPWASRLLAMAKDIRGLCPIGIRKVFFDLVLAPNPTTSGAILKAPIPHQFEVSNFGGCEAAFFVI